MTQAQKLTLVFLRLAIGWHFLYEGLVKLANPNWTSAGYLMDSAGFLKQFYYNLALNPDILQVVDFLNIWGLILIGAGLIIGAFTRVAIISGLVLMVFYYFSHPPFVGLKYAVPGDGSYLVVNKMVIEALSLAVLLVFPTWKEWGVDRWIGRRAKSIGRRA
jgi:thiosulfate dehydrogenase [quinone] large subunit